MNGDLEAFYVRARRTLLDNDVTEIVSMDGDRRSSKIAVAGPGALLVAKLHKLGERQQRLDRFHAKDALDVLRLLRGISTRRLADSLERQIESPISSSAATGAIVYLESLFGSQTAPGSQLAGDAVIGIEDPLVIQASAAALASDLIRAMSTDSR